MRHSKAFGGARVTWDRKEGRPVPLPEAPRVFAHIHHAFVAKTRAGVQWWKVGEMAHTDAIFFHVK